MGETWHQRSGRSSSLQGENNSQNSVYPSVYLYKVKIINKTLFIPQVSVDGHALAFIEDQQAPTYIHNSVVVNGSQVVVR